MKRLAWVTVAALLSLLPSSAAPTGTASTDAGAAAAVPAPFEPVSTDGFGAEGGGTVRVWGRVYRFGAGPFPSSIVTQGRELLARPPSLRLETDAGAVEPAFAAPRLESSDARKAVIASAGQAGALRVEARTTVEYDGMIRVDLTLRAPAGTEIDRFRYELPLRRDVAEFFDRHVEYDYQGLNVDKAQLLSSAGRLSESGLELPYVPTLSLGDHQVGLEWWAETDADWAVRPSAKPIRVAVTPNDATLSVEPVAKGLSLDSKGWRHTFALFPLPARLPPPRWRSNRFLGHGGAERFDRSVGIRYVWIVFPPLMDARWHGLPETVPSFAQRELRTQMSERGEAYIPYGKLTAAPSFHPLTLEHALDWAANRQRFTAPPAGEKEVLAAHTAWKPREPYGYAVCMDGPGYVDFMVGENLRILELEKTDGLYFDFGSITRPCMGRTGIERPRWPYFAVREFYMRLYEGMKKIRPEALLTIHTHGQPRALGAWADYVFVGEALYDVFGEGKPANRYDADYAALPAGFLEGLVFPHAGGITSILPEIRFGDTSDLDRLRRRQRALFAFTLPNDVPIWVANSYNEEVWSVLQAFDRFGSLDDAAVHPWWKRADTAPIRITYYARPEEVLAVVANESDRIVDTTIDVPWQDLGTKPAKRWYDLETKLQDRLPEQGSVRISVRPRDFRLLHFR